VEFQQTLQLAKKLRETINEQVQQLRNDLSGVGLEARLDGTRQLADILKIVVQSLDQLNKYTTIAPQSSQSETAVDVEREITEYIGVAKLKR
jgi:hypothetical protein